MALNFSVRFSCLLVSSHAFFQNFFFENFFTFQKLVVSITAYFLNKTNNIFSITFILLVFAIQSLKKMRILFFVNFGLVFYQFCLLDC